jgi:hypothetical protein
MRAPMVDVVKQIDQQQAEHSTQRGIVDLMDRDARRTAVQGCNERKHRREMRQVRSLDA